MARPGRGPPATTVIGEEGATPKKDGYYSPARLAGPSPATRLRAQREGWPDPILTGEQEPLLVAWGAYYGGAWPATLRRYARPDEGDARPILAAERGPRPPADPRLMDVDAAVRGAPLSDTERAAVVLYYCLYGPAAPGPAPKRGPLTVLDRVAADEAHAREERRYALHGDAGDAGDRAVARALHCATSTARRHRHAAVAKLAAYLGYEDEPEAEGGRDAAR